MLTTMEMSSPHLKTLRSIGNGKTLEIHPSILNPRALALALMATILGWMLCMTRLLMHFQFAIALPPKHTFQSGTI